MKNIKIIAKKLEKIWKKLYIIWWYSRAKVLWINYDWDIDLTTDATPLEMQKVLFVVAEVWKKYWTMIIKEWNQVFEITTFREDIWILDNRKPVEVKFTQNLELDSKRRDFTINSIYYDVKNDTFIDPENWIDDLKNKVIRFVWVPQDRINEDALRILRFIRFKNLYNLSSAEDNYFEIIKNNIHLLKNISLERVKEEFEKIILLKNNIEALKDLKKIWFFHIFFSEIDILDTVPWSPKYHLEWDVWIHTLMTIEELNKIFEDWFLISENNWKDTKMYFSKNEKIALYRTMLLHDIWKYDTYSIDESWNSHYYDHEHAWLDKFDIIQKRFIFTNKEKDIITFIIDNHLKIFKVPYMRKLKGRKFMMHKYFIYLMIAWIVDHLWRIPTDPYLIIELKDFYKEFMLILKDKKFFTWDDIIKKYPELKKADIKRKLEALNDNVLFK